MVSLKKDYCLFLPSKNILAPAFVPLLTRKNTISFFDRAIRYLDQHAYFTRYPFEPDKILTFSPVATSETRTLYHPPPILVHE
jgi:hypothetical protein